MQPIQAVIATWPFPPGKIDPLVFFRESPLRFQGLMKSDELLELLQRGAFTVVEYVLPQASGSCVPRLWIRYSASVRGEQFAVSVAGNNGEEREPCFESSDRAALEPWLAKFIGADAEATLASQSTRGIESIADAHVPGPPASPKTFIVAYVRTGERRRSGHGVRAAYEYRKAHGNARLWPQVDIAAASADAAPDTRQSDPAAAPDDGTDLLHAIRNGQSDAGQLRDPGHRRR